MEVTESGTTKIDSILRSLNAPFPILVTPSGINELLHPAIKTPVAVSIIHLQFSLESYVLLFGDMLMISKPPHQTNAISSINETFSGISIDVICQHDSKAYCPILVKSSSNVIVPTPLINSWDATLQLKADSLMRIFSLAV